MSHSFDDTDIAVVGMACRVPGANNIEQYWENLSNGIESIEIYDNKSLLDSGVPEDVLDDPNYVKSGCPLDNMEMFDAGFFGFSPKDAAIMDPQHRHFLEVSWEALEHAGYDPESYSGSIGVFAGSGHNSYMPYNLFTNPELLDNVGLFLLRHTSNDKDFLTTRASYCFDLKGPSINVQTACSTSLVATHLAVQSLLGGECDMALAGGVTIELPHRVGYLYKEGEILSPDGHCRAFDVDSKGTIFGSGAGVVVLKRADDAVSDNDSIYAIIKGSAINNDGSSKVGYLAPSVDGQSAAILEALELSNVPAESISYVETHGTGTPVGDPIEIAALTQAYNTQTDKTGFCAIGSVKTNIGHLDTAAGVAGLIKIILSLKNKKIPPSLNYKKPNPAIDFEHSPFYVNSKLSDWKSNTTPRRAAINSLGVGGTNSHIIIEEAPDTISSDVSLNNHLLVFSAKTKSSLNNYKEKLAEYLNNHADINITDVSYTQRNGRKPMKYRAALSARNIDEAVSILTESKSEFINESEAIENLEKVTFMFTGQGSQYSGMSKHLYESEELYRNEVNKCVEIANKFINSDIKEIIFSSESSEDVKNRLNDTEITQPALFIVEYCLAKLWQSWGVMPDYMIGHSIGEYVAACISNVINLEDAIKLVCARGRLMNSLPRGSMLVVSLDKEDIRGYLNEEISLAAANSPGLCVVSGKEEHIEALETKLQNKDIGCRKLKTSHAFHSEMMTPILSTFKSEMGEMEFNSPTIPFVSNLTGDWADERVTSPEYWADHLRNTVLFEEGMNKILSMQHGMALIEIGPGNTLSTFTAANNNKNDNHVIINSLPHPKKDTQDDLFIYSNLGKLWCSGYSVDWSYYDGDKKYSRIGLPTYCFDHQKYWITPGEKVTEKAHSSRLHKKNINEWLYQPGWKAKAIPKVSLLDKSANILHFRNTTEFSTDLHNELQKIDANLITVENDDSYASGNNKYSINLTSEVDCRQLFEELSNNNTKITHVVISMLYGESGNEEYEEAFKLYYSSIFNISKCMQEYFTDQDIQLTILMDSQSLPYNSNLMNPYQSLAAGPIKVLAQESGTVNIKWIDLNNFSANDNKTLFDIKYIINDIFEHRDEEHVAYYGNSRFLKDYEKINYNLEETTLFEQKDISVFAITGGLGGLSGKLAVHLSKLKNSKLIILSRTTEEDIKNSDINTGKYDVLNEITANALSVDIIVGDVTSKDDVNNLFNHIKKNYKHLDVLFHTAGIVKDNILSLKTLEESRDVLDVKVRGAINIGESLKLIKPSKIVFFSSISSILGLSGQADYTSANLFLDEYATYLRETADVPTYSFNWSVWRETGMAVDIANNLGESDGYSSKELKHHIFDSVKKIRNDIIEYSGKLTTENCWFLNEHRSKNGVALIPGTAYLEIAKAAYSIENEGDIQISEIYFISPFVVSDGKVKEIKITIQKQAIGSQFSITGTNGDEHVRGVINTLDNNSNFTSINIESILSRCNKKTEDRRESADHKYLQFGDRWKCTNYIHYGKKEALIDLQLDKHYLSDLNEYTLHPALLDMATGTAQTLNPDYDPSVDLFIPVSYGQINVYKPLPGRFFSHVVYEAVEGEGSNTSVFNIQLFDTEGNILVTIDEFVMKKINPAGLMNLQDNSENNVEKVNVLSPAEEFFLQGYRTGINNEEGFRIIDFTTTFLDIPQVVVSAVDLHEYIANARNLRSTSDMAMPTNEEPVVSQARPNVATDYIEPKSDEEKIIASIWKTMLGLSEVGIDDDFFELGGHSLLLTQTISRLRKKFNTDLPVPKLFESPSVREWASIISSNLDSEVSSIPLVMPVDRREFTRNRNTLMQLAS